MSRSATSSKRSGWSRCFGRCDRRNTPRKAVVWRPLWQDPPFGTIRMIVGSRRVRLLVRESRSLKDKRQVIKSIKDRMHNRFNVSVAEVEALDNRQLAVLGL